MAIKEIITGGEPKENRGATTGFVQKILDYETDHNLKPEIGKKLRDYASAHIQIAMKNMLKSAPVPIEPAMGAEMPTEPLTPQGQTAQRSANISQIMTQM